MNTIKDILFLTIEVAVFFYLCLSAAIIVTMKEGSFDQDFQKYWFMRLPTMAILWGLSYILIVVSILSYFN